LITFLSAIVKQSRHKRKYDSTIFSVVFIPFIILHKKLEQLVRDNYFSHILRPALPSGNAAVKSGGTFAIAKCAELLAVR